jgi:RNA polymerase sigma-70 factor (ECF subfamily)
LSWFNKNRISASSFGSDTSELELARACATNNRLAQEALYRRYFEKMFRMCLKHAHGDEERALEMTNDGFLRVFKKIETFKGAGSLEGWVRKLVFHAISDYYQTNKKYFDLIELTDDAGETAAPTGGVFQNIFLDDVLQSLDILPPATRQVMQLYAVEGYKHEEIAAQLGISVGTSKWHLSAARERLKKILRP